MKLHWVQNSFCSFTVFCVGFLPAILKDFLRFKQLTVVNIVLALCFYFISEGL